MVENGLNVAHEQGAPFLLSVHPKNFSPHPIMATAMVCCGLGIEFINMHSPEYSETNEGRDGALTMGCLHVWGPG